MTFGKIGWEVTSVIPTILQPRGEGAKAKWNIVSGLPEAIFP
jgi:hypothetical protein